MVWNESKEGKETNRIKQRICRKNLIKHVLIYYFLRLHTTLMLFEEIPLTMLVDRSALYIRYNFAEMRKGFAAYMHILSQYLVRIINYKL